MYDQLTADLQREVERLRQAGDKVAKAVEDRWSGDGRCDCDCCTAAREWRAATS